MSHVTCIRLCSMYSFIMRSLLSRSNENSSFSNVSRAAFVSIFCNCAACCPCQKKTNSCKNISDKVRRLLYVKVVLHLQPSKHLQSSLSFRFCRSCVSDEKSPEQSPKVREFLFRLVYHSPPLKILA